jgi:hypothetical protein
MAEMKTFDSIFGKIVWSMRVGSNVRSAREMCMRLQ